MTRLTVICILQAAIPILGFYHEPSVIPLNISPSLQNDSYFGYSMAYEDNDKALLIGAPACDKFGKVFQFDLTKDGKLYETIISPLEKENNTLAEHDWFGATIKHYNGRGFVICAPRNINTHVRRETKQEVHITRGQCYLRSPKESLTLADISQNDRNILSYGIDGFGWSVDIEKNATDLGSIWIASPILTSVIKIYRSITSKTRFLPFKGPNNFGYSIVSGNFLSVTGHDHAVSDTYGDGGMGKVFIFTKDLLIKATVVLTGGNDAVGSTFGAALCKAYLGDKRASLLVGAPTFVTGRDGYDRGAVYIYVPNNETDSKSLILIRIIKGEKDAAYFGQAIASLGDLDGDEKDEVAISAPFEDGGRGVVYIYSGAGLLENRTWIQRISSESKSFGFSLLPLPDYTNNALDGLSVGAPLENKVYVFKPIPSITVNVDVISLNVTSREDKDLFINFATVINVTYPKITEQIRTKLRYKIWYPTMGHAMSDGIHSVFNEETIPLINKSESIIKPFRVFRPSDKNFNVPILYNVLVELDDEEDRQYKGRVIRSERSIMSKEIKLPVPGCMATECVPILHVEIDTKIKEPYTVGSSDMEYFSVTVHNSGETAYAPCAAFSVHGAVLLRAPQACVLVHEQAVCRATQPIRPNQEWNIPNIELGMDSLISRKKGIDSINIKYDVYNDCNNKKNKISGNKHIALRYENRIHIIGITVPSEPVVITSSDLKSGTRFQHRYTILNNGNINWKDVKCEILLQKRNYLKYPKYVTIRKKDVTTECLFDEKKANDTSYIVECNIEDLLKNSVIEVFVDIEVLPNMLGEESVPVPSKLTLILIEEESISKNLTSTMVIKTKSVPVWVIVIAVLFGLLILSLIGCILYKYKCFERKDKKKLEDLKTQTNNHDGDAIADGNYNVLQEEENIIVGVELHSELNAEHYAERSVDHNADHNVETSEEHSDAELL